MKTTICCLLISVFSLFSFKGENKVSLDFTEDGLYVCSDFTAAGIFTSGCEGPAVDAEGNLYAVNLNKNGTVAIIDTLGNASVFATLPAASIGNGIRIDKAGNMYIADYTAHNILKIPAGKTVAEVYVHNESFNQPNDLAIMSNGILFASDPNWNNNTGKLWRIGTDKIPVLLDGNMGTTNGIEVSQDEKRLYVNESFQRKIWKYDLNEKGEISNKTLFASFTDYNLDGMRCDIDGNLYVARFDKGVVAIISPDGLLLREVITKGKQVTNIAFGGKDGRTCFVTLADRKMIETFRTETPGREWELNQAVTGFMPVLEFNNRIEIYPNPTREGIILSGLLPGSVITVFDINWESKITFVNYTENEFVDVRNWSKGIYLVRVQTHGNTQIKKVIVG